MSSSLAEQPDGAQTYIQSRRYQHPANPIPNACIQAEFNRNDPVMQRQPYRDGSREQKRRRRYHAGFVGRRSHVVPCKVHCYAMILFMALSKDLICIAGKTEASPALFPPGRLFPAQMKLRISTVTFSVPRRA
jgi:hypothetical protein